MTSSPRTIVHVSKYPPSPSGIGLYAQVFDTALSKVGTVRRHVAPPHPSASQSLGAATRGLLAGWRQGRRSPEELVHVELGGRGLYEFYFALGAIRAGATVSLTLHDLPSLVGPSLLFRELDRKGLRRLGESLSEFVGMRLENQVLHGATAICTLTQAGARWLRETKKVDAVFLGHIADSPALDLKQDIVFCPGYNNDSDSIIELATLIKSAAPGYHVLVGVCSHDAGRAIRRAVAAYSLPVGFTGHLTERELLKTFSAARVVVRLRRPGVGTNHLAASGPLVWAATRGCVVITNDTRPGAQELDELGLVRVTVEWQQSTVDAIKRPSSAERAQDIAEATRKELGAGPIAARYAAAVIR